MLQTFQIKSSEPFEIKPQLTICPREDNLLSFGDLVDLQSTRLASRGFGFEQNYTLHRRFHRGNYVLSTISDSPWDGSSKKNSSSPILIVHHENLDPNLIVEKLREETTKMKNKREAAASSEGNADSTYDDDEQDDASNPYDTKMKCTINSSEWMIGIKKLVETGRPDDDETRRKLHYEAEEERFARFNEKIFGKLKEALGPSGSKMERLPELFYIVQKLAWIAERDDWKFVVVNDTIYRLEMDDGEVIGFAFDFKEYFGTSKLRGTLLQNSSTFGLDIYRDLYMAMIVEADEGDGSPRLEDFSFPLTSFLYANVFRRFHENNRDIPNRYYGPIDSSASSRPPYDYFSRLLPPNLFVKILGMLPWRQRVACRRVNKQWMKMSNSIVGVTTKSIDLEHFGQWESEDLERMIKIVGDRLETLKFPRSLHRFQEYNMDFVTLVNSFRSLKTADFGAYQLRYERVRAFLDRCTNLKTLTAAIQVDLKVDLYEEHRKQYGTIEELHLHRPDAGGNGAGASDPYFMAIADYFPNVRRMFIDALDHLTGSGASAFVQRYGPSFEHLEIQFTRRDYVPFWYDDHWTPSLGDFTGIAACTNLSTLVLTSSYLVTDGFMEALSRGCTSLETLDLHGAKTLTDEGLGRLAALPRLTRLNISSAARRLNDGLMRVVREGRLIQLLLREFDPSDEVVKACVRYCRSLTVLDIRGEGLTVEDDLEVLNLYGRFGRTERLLLRSYNRSWNDPRVGELQLAVKNGEQHQHRGRFVIDMRLEPNGFVESNDERELDDDPNVLVFFDEGDDEDYEDEDGEDDDEDGMYEDEDDFHFFGAALAYGGLVMGDVVYEGDDGEDEVEMDDDYYPFNP